MERAQVINRDPEVLGGIPVFVGTRVPVQTFIDYLKGGDRLDDFLTLAGSWRLCAGRRALSLARSNRLTDVEAAMPEVNGILGRVRPGELAVVAV